MKLQHKQTLLQKRRWRVRKKVGGTALRPRMCVRFTHKHVYVQIINDDTSATLVSATSTAKETRDAQLKANVASATEVGKLIGEKAKAAGIERVVFDRGSRCYHGCVKALADAARETGLQF